MTWTLEQARANLEKFDPIHPVEIKVATGEILQRVGMSRREFFAAHAMTMFKAPEVGNMSYWDTKTLARDCVMLADAIIAELDNIP